MGSVGTSGYPVRDGTVTVTTAVMAYLHICTQGPLGLENH